MSIVASLRGSLMQVKAMAAVNQERLTGRELGFRQAEETHRGSKALGAAQPTGGDVA
jgi:hypothetical protein